MQMRRDRIQMHFEDIESRGFVDGLDERFERENERSQGPLQGLWPARLKDNIAIHGCCEDNGEEQPRTFVLEMFS